MSTLPGIGIFGNNAAVHLLTPALREKGFRVEAVWGRTRADAERTATVLGIPFYTTKIDEVVLRKNVDLIIIFSDPHLHSQISVKALGIGKHVVCDRPAGLNQTEALRMVQAAAYYSSLLAMVSYSLRFLPNYTLMRQMIQDKYIGTPTLCDVRTVSCIRISCGSLLGNSCYSWRCDAAMGGGVVALLASHIIDLASYLGLGLATRVQATLRTLTPTTDNIGGIRHVTADDFAVLQLQMSGGALATILINSCLDGFTQEVSVCGTEGRLVARDGDLRGAKRGGREELLLLELEEEEPPADNTSPCLSRLHIKGLKRMAAFLFDKFSTNSSSSSSQEPALFNQGLYVQSVIEALRKSHETRQWTKVRTMVEEGALTESSAWSSFA